MLPKLNHVNQASKLQDFFGFLTLLHFTSGTSEHHHSQKLTTSLLKVNHNIIKNNYIAQYRKLLNENLLQAISIQETSQRMESSRTVPAAPPLVLGREAGHRGRHAREGQEDLGVDVVRIEVDL